MRATSSEGALRDEYQAAEKTTPEDSVHRLRRNVGQKRFQTYSTIMNPGKHSSIVGEEIRVYLSGKTIVRAKRTGA